MLERGLSVEGVRMCDELDVQLGRRIRRRRRLLGLTQEEVGAACGVRAQQVQKYESAANKMSAGMIGRLAQVLEVDVGHFYQGLHSLLATQQVRARRPRGDLTERRAAVGDLAV